jgi:asparagine synthase (glutamine-hydrolysing)
MQVGFTVLSRDGGVEFQLFGTREGERFLLVTFCQAAGCSAVLLGRLYYRQEFLAALAPHPERVLAERCRSDDAALALAAYRRFGPGGIARLEGDFALALWDAREKRLLAARDPLGGYPLFWSENAGAVALGTSLPHLLRLGPERELDLDYLAEFLMLPRCSIQEVAGERCAYEGIHHLLPGNVLTVQPPGGAVRRRAYWDWLERMTDPGTERPEEAGARYAQLLRQAVRERLRGRTASHLSGGMDSTSVCLLAADAVRSGGEAPLHALSLVYERLTGLARETPYIEDVLRRHPDIVAHRVCGDELLDFDGFTDPPPHDEPWPALARSAMDCGLTLAAADAGAHTVLTGIGADEILDLPPLHITDLLRAGRLGAAWVEAARWARASTCSLWNVFYPFGLANLLPAWAHVGLGPLLRQGYASWEKQSDYTIAPWIRPGFARRYGLRARGLDYVRRTYSAGWPAALALALTAIADSAGDVGHWCLAAPRGMAVANPFLDPRVLRFGLGSLVRLRVEPGRQKPLLNEAMRDVLPDRIRNRARKGHFNEVYFLGLARNLPGLEAMVRHAPVEDLGIFDREVLLRCLHQAALGIVKDMNGLSRLNLSLALFQWLTRQREWCKAVGPPTKVIRMDGAGEAPEARGAAPLAVGRLAEPAAAGLE